MLLEPRVYIRNTLLAGIISLSLPVISLSMYLNGFDHCMAPVIAGLSILLLIQTIGLFALLKDILSLGIFVWMRNNFGNAV